MAIQFSEKSSMIVFRWVRNCRKEKSRFRAGEGALESNDGAYRRTWGCYGLEEEEAALARLR